MSTLLYSAILLAAVGMNFGWSLRRARRHSLLGICWRGRQSRPENN
ncbi:hypothetical protein HXW90_14315 [Pseudomonas sp. Y39-6]|jgi:hypothetical protein|nr:MULTISPECIES: hypothetical protein [Pseudomonas]MCT8960673.1 hypothetical protein [Pseudomonas veronii]NMX36602.1 hypothetical protein [Pseudomonas veronii]NWC56067.1 hypothetical protein [Pseudomonas veronii]QPO20649.1 hypothetical protein HXW90_14315 [Pseudomonas sp. Y39-6]URS63816.1 hypothetical protein JN756_14580 [Pseudomonas sp. Y39-6]